MKTLTVALLALAAVQPSIVLAGGGGAYGVSGAVVVGGPVGPRGGYYGHGPRRGYPGPRVGVYVGGPVVWGGPWVPVYNPPAVVYPPVVAVPPPVVYVERSDEIPAATSDSADPLEPGYWYYCREQGAYYPAVRQCPSAWQKVAPVDN